MSQLLPHNIQKGDSKLTFLYYCSHVALVSISAIISLNRRS